MCCAELFYERQQSLYQQQVVPLTVKDIAFTTLFTVQSNLVSLLTAGVDFTAPDMNQIVITLSNSSRRGNVTIMTTFDDNPSNTDKQFQVLLSPSIDSASIIYMPTVTNVTVTNRMSIINCENNTRNLYD